jgi:phage recombination protein Bet
MSENKLKNVDETLKDIAILPRKTLTELINETDESIYYTLKNSIYPGAKDESIAMVIAACKARDYPVLSKCYHIVPMSVKNAQADKYEWRDVIMPGIALYRIEADRSKTYIGLSEPIYGPMIKETLGGKVVEYPEWCKIIASKTLPNGNRADFPSIEYWKENYATKGKDSLEPNAMWSKRPRAQLAKCTEAQALRRAFPDILGSNVTFEEMEDKPQIKDVYGSVVEIAAPNREDSETKINPDQLEILQLKIEQSKSEVDKLCKHYNIEKLEDMTLSQWPNVVRVLDKKIKQTIQSDALKEMVDNKSVPEVDQFIADLGEVEAKL